MVRKLAVALVGTALLGGTAAIVPVTQPGPLPTDAIPLGTGGANTWTAATVTNFDTPSGQMEDGFYYALETGGFIAQGPNLPAATNHQQFFDTVPLGFKEAHIIGYTNQVFYLENGIGKAAALSAGQYRSLATSSFDILKQPVQTTLLGSVLGTAAQAAIAFDNSKGGQITGTSLTYSQVVNGPNAFLAANWSALTGHLKTMTYAGVATSSTNTTTFPGSGRVGTLIVSWNAPSIGTNNIVTTTDGTSLAFVASSTAFSGVSQTGQPEVNTGSGGATSAASTCTLTTITDQSWMFISDANAAGSDTAGANTNIRGTNGNGEGYGDGGPFAVGANTLTLNHGSGLWATVCLSFAPAPAAAAPVSDSSQWFNVL